MFIPIWLLLLAGLLVSAYILWTILLILNRNPLPFPDRGSRIFTAASVEGKKAIVDLLATHGIFERFEANSAGVLRSIMWDGTIINLPSPDVFEKLGEPSASIGLVSQRPVEAAQQAAEFLRSRSFEAEVILDAEPELPIAFVSTNAMKGTVINFRKHVIHMPKPK